MALHLSCIGQDEGRPEIIRGNENFELLVKVINIKTNRVVDGTEVYLYTTSDNRLISIVPFSFPTARFSAIIWFCKPLDFIDLIKLLNKYLCGSKEYTLPFLYNVFAHTKLK